MRAAHTSTVPQLSLVTETPDVSVIIVNYNVREFLEQALESLHQASGSLHIETFVVDNDSADGSVAMVEERFPAVRVIANEANVGFAAANNQGIREATGRFLLILNPDTLVQEDTLLTLVRFMDAHPEAGAVGCRILNPDGSFAPESRRAFPTPAVAFYRLTGLSRLFPHSATFGRYNLTYLPRDQVCEVDALSGSCMMVRRDALYASREEYGGTGEGANEGDGAIGTPPTPRGGAGLLDENFFMYGEDLDWCYRIQQAGWRIYYTPDTQIIHYKGESTKKGELRYVRLFYGAMLRFVEKHFSANQEASRLQRLGSRGLALGIRMGIVVRALLSFVGRVLSSLRSPLVDGALAAFAMMGAALLWDLRITASFSTPFYTTVAPAYALAAVLGIALGGGYRRGRTRRLRPVLAGLFSALIGVATLSFFIKSIAFSRGALLLGFAFAGVFLTAWRLLERRRPKTTRRVILVGAEQEALRLQRLTGGRMRPSIQLAGFVSDQYSAGSAVPHLGTLRHLRDIARLRHADDIVFAADSLSNTDILGLMRQLRDLPVQLKILASGRDRIIGKASVEDFSVPFVEAERAVAPLRSTAGRRLLEIPVALLGIALRPVLHLLLRLRPTNGRLQWWNALAAQMPAVLAGHKALVGYVEDAPHPPADWGLPPGFLSILDTLPERPASIVDAQRAYWFYARNQSLALDVDIVRRALMRAEGHGTRSDS